MFVCPGCSKDSSSSKFDIDQKTKRMQCRTCLRIDGIEAFRAIPLPSRAPSGMISDGALFVTSMLAILAFALVFCFAPFPRGNAPSPDTARAAEAAWAKLTEEQAAHCRRKMSALSRALEPGVFPIPEESEAFYEDCMGMYSEE